MRWTGQKYFDHKSKDDRESDSSDDKDKHIDETNDRNHDEQDEKKTLDDAASKRLESALKNSIPFIIQRKWDHWGLMKITVLLEGRMKSTIIQ